MSKRTLTFLSLTGLALMAIASFARPTETASATRGRLRPIHLSGTVTAVGYEDTNDHRMVVVSVRTRRLRGRSPQVQVVNPRIEALFQSGQIVGGPGAVGPRSAFINQRVFRRGEITHLAYRCELRGEGRRCARAGSHMLPLTIGDRVDLQLVSSVPNDRVIVPTGPMATGPHTNPAGPTFRRVNGSTVGAPIQVHVTDPEDLTTTPGPMVVPR